MSAYDYDVIVIGSGFEGSVAALRATVKPLALHEVRELDGEIQTRI